MNITKVFGCLGALLLGLGFSARSEAAAKALALADEKEVMQLGMPETLFQGVPAWMKEAGAGPFLKMMKTQTGFDGKLNFSPDGLALAEQINAGKIHIGVFQGHEFAFARNKYPNLIPVAVTSPLRPNQAFCIVRWNCKAADIGGLKGEKISLPPVHRDYCEMFLAKQKADHMKGGNFSGTLKAATAADAIQDVIDEKAALTVVDAATVHFFQQVFPGQFKNVKILCQSDPFPSGCVVVKKDELDPKTIEKFRKALFNAPTDPVGKPMLATWKLNGFQIVPDDYELQLKKVLKTYPGLPAIRAAIDK